MFQSRVVDKALEDWIFTEWDKLHIRLGPDQPLSQTRLVLPAPGFFELDAETPETKAEAIFDKVKTYAGMEDWAVNLEAFEAHKHEQVSDYVVMQPAEPVPAGLFQVDGQETPTIRFDIALVDSPSSLIATFAHELAHYLLWSTGHYEGDIDLDDELITDLAAVYLGFGVFLANDAFEMRGESGYYGSSWSWRRAGYLSEDSFLLATALFVETSIMPHDAATPYLKPHLGKRFPKALKQILRRSDDLERIWKRDTSFVKKADES